MQVANIKENVRIYAVKPRDCNTAKFFWKNVLGKIYLDQRTGTYWGARRVGYTHVRTKVQCEKEYVRFLTSSCLTLCRKCYSNLLFTPASEQKPQNWKY